MIELYCSFDNKYLLVNINLKIDFKNNKRFALAKNVEEKNEKGAELSALVLNALE